MFGFRAELVEAPPLRARNAGGYGSAIVVRPGTSQVVFSRHIGSARTPWLVFDVGTGDFAERKGLAGDLQDGVFDDDGAWLLAGYGLCRADFDPPAVVDVVKKGIGSYQHRLFRLSDRLLGLARVGGPTLLVVDSGDGAVRKRVRVPAPDLVLPQQDGTAVLCSFESGTAHRLDVESLRAEAVTELPEAISPIEVDDTIVALTGEPESWLTVVEAEHAVSNLALDALGPIGRLVRKIARVRPAETPAAWRTRPDGLAEVDRETLELRRRVGGGAGLYELLGTDSAGRVIAAAEDGLAVLGAERLEVVARFEDERASGPACWVAEAGAVVFLRHYLASSPARGFDPVPESLLVVRWNGGG